MADKIKWSIDPEKSKIIFKVDGLIFSSVEGTFQKFDAAILTDEKDFNTAEITLRIDVSTITTGDINRDEHLKSDDFFDCENYKEITFRSCDIQEADSDGIHKLAGELTIKNITKRIILDVQFSPILNDQWGNEIAGFAITGKIHRKTWGLTWNAAFETGGLMVSEEATLSCEIQLVNEGQKHQKAELFSIA